MSDYWKLDGHTPVPCTLDEYAAWMSSGKNPRQVAYEEIGGVRISTVFLMIDHSFGEGPPILFETMIFGGVHDEDQWRYTSWDEAEKGHARAVAWAKGELKEMPA